MLGQYKAYNNNIPHINVELINMCPSVQQLHKVENLQRYEVVQLDARTLTNGPTYQTSNGPKSKSTLHCNQSQALIQR